MTNAAKGLYACGFASIDAYHWGVTELWHMKYFLLVIGLLAALIAALIYVPMKNGEPLLHPDKARQLLNETTKLLPSTTESKVEEELPAMYRWRDASGNWQFGQVPPIGVEAEPLQRKEVRSLSADEVRQGAPVQK
jgi:hypothetical protein